MESPLLNRDASDHSSVDDAVKCERSRDAESSYDGPGCDVANVGNIRRLRVEHNVMLYARVVLKGRIGAFDNR